MNLILDGVISTIIYLGGLQGSLTDLTKTIIPRKHCTETDSTECKEAITSLKRCKEVWQGSNCEEANLTEVIALRQMARSITVLICKKTMFLICRDECLVAQHRKAKTKQVHHFQKF